MGSRFFADDRLLDETIHWSKRDLALVFVAALAFYSLTLAPTVEWGDSAILSLNAFQGSYRLTAASDHPLFVLVAHFFTVLPGDVGRNVNLVSALFGAMAVSLVYGCGRQLGVSRVAACVGAAALCVSHAFWLHSVIAEVYTANAFFLAATLILLLIWRERQRTGWLVAAGAAFAIGLTNHLALASALPAAVLFVIATVGRRLFTGRFLAWMAVAVAGSVWIALTPSLPVAALLKSFWVGPPGISEYFWLPDPALLPQEIGYYLLFLVYQFPTISFALGLVGAFALFRARPAVTLLLLGIVAVNSGIFIRHTIWPSAASAKYVFYITDYVVFSILCAIGAERVLQRSNTRQGRRLLAGLTLLVLTALVPPALYAVAPWATESMGFDLIRASDLPYRDSDHFFLNPNKRGDDGARRFGEEALDAVEPRAVIFADYTPHSVLMYLQVVEGRRPDVVLQSARYFGQTVPVRWMFDQGRRRPAYLATLTPGYYDFGGLTGHYELVPAGPIFQVRAQ